MNKRAEELKNDVTRIGNEVKDAGRSVWLAGLGAFSEAESQGRAFFDSLVEKGRKTQDARKKDLEDALSGTNKRIRRVGEWFTGTAEQAVDRVSGLTNETLQRFGVPTYEDIRTLNERVAELNRKVEALGNN